jgi:hypothetical protein
MSRRRVRNVEYTDAPLDMLLRHDEPVPVPVPDDQSSWLPRAALYTFLASAVAYTGLHIVGLAPPYFLILVVCAGSVLVRQAVGFVRETGTRTRDIVRSRGRRRQIVGGWYVTDDGMYEAVRRWDRRLDWGSTAPERFHHTMTGRLADLVDERLRQRHGITLAGDPGRARALVGEEVWALISGVGRRPPTPREVYVLVQRMEAL